MTATERAKRSDALYYETVSVTRRVLCDMIANREADLEDARESVKRLMTQRDKRLVRAEAENAKLRELVGDMYGFIERMDEECGDVTFSDCFDYCKHDATDDGCCKTGECWYEQRMRELGVVE